MKLVLNITVESIATRVDGTLKFTLGTQELDPSQAAALFQLRGKYAKVLLSDSNITAIEEKLIDEEPVQDGRKIKSQAQRIRAVLYRNWEQSGLSIPFDDYYRTETERIITHYKDKLNKLTA